MFPLSMSMSMTDDRASPDNSTSVNVTTAETIAPTNATSVNETLDILPSDVDTDDVDLSEESVQVAGEDTPPSGSPATTAVVAITGVGGMVITLLIFRHT